MNKLDRMIEEALAEEERALMSETAELSFFAQLFAQYRGRNAWVTWASTVGIVAYVVLMVWAAWNFFTADDPVAAVQFGALGGLSIMAIGMMKLYLLNEMQTARVMRELKRLELMLASREK